MCIDKSAWSREQTWPPEPVSVSHARRFLHETVDIWSLQAVGDDAAVVLSELATNAVIHARTDFTVRLSPSGQQALRLSVTDGSAEMPRRVTDRHATSGRGLELIDALSADWGATRNGVEGKAVWAVLSPHHLHPLGAPRPELPGRRPLSPGQSLGELSGGGHPSAGTYRRPGDAHAVTFRECPAAALAHQHWLGGKVHGGGQAARMDARWARCARHTVTGRRHCTLTPWLPHPHPHPSGSPPKTP
jgi:hypothetical protein